MKRGITVKSLIVITCAVGSAVAGCSPAPENAPPQASDDGGWMHPPSIASVEWKAGSIGAEGVTMPFGRVVFAGEEGQSYAVTADNGGRFVVWLQVPETGALLNTGLQTERGAVVAPGVLFAAGGQHPAAAVLYAGEGAYRLDGVGPIDAVDGDGQTVIVSGRGKPNGSFSVQVASQTIPVTADGGGRWAVVAPADVGPVTIAMENRSYVYPGTHARGSDSYRGYINGGWLVRRKFADGAVQTTWLP